uniref:Cwf19-like protein C-terminal domain-containing protein n=1 Tax=Acrobeloides nanus TaxID=290746 RepID=A0A914DA91_9BILA
MGSGQTKIKAIMESDREEGESDNKKLLDLSKYKTPDIRSAVPKGFPFFAVDFGLQAGYAHVIEDDSRFPSYFAQEIVGNLLDLSPRHWRNPQALKFDEIKKRKDAFEVKWQKYDWTKMAKRAVDT